MIRALMILAMPAILAACATAPRPEHVVAAMAPVAYETAAKTVLARHEAKPFTDAQKAQAKAVDQKAFDALETVMDAQAARVLALHLSIQGL